MKIQERLLDYWDFFCKWGSKPFDEIKGIIQNIVATLDNLSLIIYFGMYLAKEGQN